MASDLKPCPFCGGEARFETYGGTACAVVCQTCGCGTPTMRLDDGMIAADLWNRRAERTCRDLTPDSDKLTCSECGAESVGQVHQKPFINVFSYCPNCGARVEEASDDADR